MLNKADKSWQARWIMDKRFHGLPVRDLFHKQVEAPPEKEEHRKDLQNIHMLVRHRFRLDALPKQALLDITADDCYKLYINGRFVGQGPAQSYAFHYYYNRLDVTPFLRAGENVIAVHVYYQGLVNRSLNSADYRQGMIAELFCDGELTVASDAKWKYRQAWEYGDGSVETIGYETQFAEHIDNRLKEKNWREIDYDDSKWQSASERDPNVFDQHTFVLQPTPIVDVYKMGPKKIVKAGDQRYIIDFGQEITGQLTMRAHGVSGQKLDIRYGEEMLDDASGVRYEMRCSTTYQETWTLSGEEDELEVYDYKGFRYVEIVGAIDVIEEASIAAIVRHYPFPEEASKFQSEHALLQDIWELCRNAVKFGSQEHYVDCPTREKGQYLGDNTITAPAHAILTGDLRLFRKALIDFANSTRICPGMMAVAPGHFMQEFADYSLQWPDQLWFYYRYTGDQEFLREMAPYAVGIAEYFRQFARADGLLDRGSDKPNLVDWPKNLRDGYDFPVDELPTAGGCHNVINAFYYRCLHMVNIIMEELGEEKPYNLQPLAEAFQHTFYDSDRGLYRDAQSSTHTSLHANILPLYAGLVPENQRKKVARFLLDKGMTCGVYMAYFYLQALLEAGEYEAAYQTIVSEERRVAEAADNEEPTQVVMTGYWANMLREGATTCFEAWSKRMKWNTSLCHPWASAPIPILVEGIFGIKPGSPGWKTIEFQPRIPKDFPDTTLTFTVTTGQVTVVVKDGKAKLIQPEGVEG